MAWLLPFKCLPPQWSTQSLLLNALKCTAKSIFINIMLRSRCCDAIPHMSVYVKIATGITLQIYVMSILSIVYNWHEVDLEPIELEDHGWDAPCAPIHYLLPYCAALVDGRQSTRAHQCACTILCRPQTCQPHVTLVSLQGTISAWSY